MMKILYFTFLVCWLIFAFETRAQQTYDSSSLNVVESKTPVEKEKFTVSGYFDTYYFANLNKPSTHNNLGSSGVSRGFDRYVGQFQLGMFMTRLNYSYKEVDFVAEVGWGPNVEYGSYGSDFRYRWGTVVANNTYSAVMLKQAYINFKASDRLLLTAGQFGTHIGYEYIDAPLNFHYSINNTFNAGIPFYHLGLKATYSFNDNISLMAGVVNGTDNINDNNRGKSVIGQLTIKPAEGFLIYLNTIQGNEANSRTSGSDTSSYFGILDIVATWQITDNLMVGTWLTYGSMKGEFQGGAYSNQMKHWEGINLYTTLKVSEVFSLGTRIEYFNNKDGARALLTQGKGTDVKTYTFTGNISLVEGKLMLKPEFRFDDFRKEKSAVGEEAAQQFADSHGNFTKHTQATIGMAVVFKF